MVTMTTAQRAPGIRQSGRHATPAGEGGFLLVMVMVVMLVVSAIAASTLINSFLEKSLAKNQNYGSIALQAAEGGVAVGQAWLNDHMDDIYDPMKDAAFYTNPTMYGWSRTICSRPNSVNPLCPTSGVTDYHPLPTGGGDYAVTLRFKREWLDKDGDGDCAEVGEISPYSDADAAAPVATDLTGHVPEHGYNCSVVFPAGEIVLFNKCGASGHGCFQLKGARANGIAPKQGYPVIEITSTGSFGTAGYRQVLLDVARNDVTPRGAHGAVTSKSGVELKGTANVYGENYDLEGNALDPTYPDMPGAFVENGYAATQVGAAAYSGDPATQVNPALCLPGPEPNCTNGFKPIYDTPWAVLNMDETEMPTPIHAANAADADAMLLNPDMLGEIVYVDFDYSPPDNARGLLVIHNAGGTAKFDFSGNKKFTGLIIADEVKITGTTEIVGAVVSMSTTTVEVSAGTPQLKFSQAALNMATKQDFSNRLQWQRIR